MEGGEQLPTEILTGRYSLRGSNKTAVLTNNDRLEYPRRLSASFVGNLSRNLKLSPVYAETLGKIPS